MIDTQRLGALLRALIRDDTLGARLRVPATTAVRAPAAIGPELAPPLQDAGTPEAPVRNPARAPQAIVDPRPAEVARDTVRIASRLPHDALVDAHFARRDAAAGEPARNDRGSDAVVPRALNGPTGPGSAALELSATGRALLAALRGVATSSAATPVPGSAMQPRSGALADGARTAAPHGVAARNPLIGVPPHSEVATDRLALQLKDAVEFSGVFYEAHLAQWADDLRPRALLTHEPQSRWPVAADIAQQVVAAEAAPADYATPLLRQQLDVLDTGRFTWRGELWPGQPGTLVIEEEEPPPQSRTGILDEPAAPRWRMRLSLEFAELGAVDVSLALCGESVDVGLRCNDPDAVTRLRGAAPALRVAIAERALDLANLTVSHDGSP